MAKNKNLHQAKNAKKDEFYTQLGDIENELRHYETHFKDKVVFCNCDDPYESNFFRYFVLNFNRLGLKKLICTCYYDSPISQTKTGKDKAHKIIINEMKDFDNNGSIDLDDARFIIEKALKDSDENVLSVLKGDKTQTSDTSLSLSLSHKPGDFRTAECIELLKQSDIVVTNPPFSLFREYVAQLIEYKKDFLIIGNVNAITYKEIFSLIKQNRLWIGASIHSGDRKFNVPNDYPLSAAGCGIDEKGNKFIRVKGVRWFTNLDYKKRHEKFETIASYHKDPNHYPKYDNYNAINVDKTIEIPLDYDGVMGVPITFLDKYNPEQFEIVALGIFGSVDFTCNKKMEILDKNGLPTGKFTFNAKGTLYRKFNPKTDKTPAFKDCETGELYSSIYARILIKNKNPQKGKK